MNGDTEEAMVDLVCGILSHRLPLAGKTVGEARARFAELMNIDPDAPSIVNGEHVDETTVLTAGQVLCFVKHAGQMG